MQPDAVILLAVLQGLVQEAQWSLGIKLCCIVEDTFEESWVMKLSC